MTKELQEKIDQYIEGRQTEEEFRDLLSDIRYYCGFYRRDIVGRLVYGTYKDVIEDMDEREIADIVYFNYSTDAWIEILLYMADHESGKYIIFDDVILTWHERRPEE